jgi:Flp pilus assembly protein TadD
VPAYALLAQGHRALGERALSARDPALAAAEARTSLELNARDADAHNLLGAALASQGDLAGAIPEFQAAVRLDPRNQSAANNLARAQTYSRSSGTPNTSK